MRCKSFNVEYLLFKHQFEDGRVLLPVLVGLQAYGRHWHIFAALYVRIVASDRFTHFLITRSEEIVLLVTTLGFIHHCIDRFNSNVNVLSSFQCLGHYGDQSNSVLAFYTSQLDALKWNYEVACHLNIEVILLKHVGLAARVQIGDEESRE